ncbi:hypothetical protein GUITHDRAFT_121214 [Guillardia theta CCMP2712]|uniref:Uncharacterized protein n=1 Tax=Guillardia theta (strain CCMP2712) TaxID=905079 RepID=L1I9N9_GUITC|nr:hypothetical protein GUITHDRAFT_121214 [Guillardia theta CCMP2712]EKX32624.1 hypothetical protein GUITHDRAFT_121214 [Guillardia theta CCMP2712]|eukprot:XP_005819604.1 hypothetical protein GUITHDRAFT_121214 [Guillardia theta CCMP2712]
MPRAGQVVTRKSRRGGGAGGDLKERTALAEDKTGTGQGRAGQGRAGQGRAGQGRAGQNNLAQNRMSAKNSPALNAAKGSSPVIVPLTSATSPAVNATSALVSPPSSGKAPVPVSPVMSGQQILVSQPVVSSQAMGPGAFAIPQVISYGGGAYNVQSAMFPQPSMIPVSQEFVSMPVQYGNVSMMYRSTDALSTGSMYASSSAIRVNQVKGSRAAWSPWHDDSHLQALRKEHGTIRYQMDRYRIRVAELEDQTKNMMIQIASVEVLQQENGNLKAEKADLLNRLNQVFQEREMIQAQSLQTITKYEETTRQLEPIIYKCDQYEKVENLRHENVELSNQFQQERERRIKLESEYEQFRARHISCESQIKSLTTQLSSYTSSIATSSSIHTSGRYSTSSVPYQSYLSGKYEVASANVPTSSS